MSSAATVDASHILTPLSGSVDQSSVTSASNPSSLFTSSSSSPPPTVSAYVPVSSLDSLTQLVTASKSRSQPAAGYPCSLCALSFPSMSRLGRHMRLHSAERPFCCQHCGRAFVAAHNMRRHETACGKRREARAEVERVTSHLSWPLWLEGIEAERAVRESRGGWEEEETEEVSRGERRHRKRALVMNRWLLSATYDRGGTGAPLDGR